jgi:chorismate-pyruvate lyase
MISEQELLTKWRSLPQYKQQEVLKFVEFMQLKTTAKKPPLGERLREIRSRIVASGKPLLNADEIEQEKVFNSRYQV